MLSLSDIVNVKVGIGRGVFEAPGATVIGGKKPSFNLEILKLFANGEQGFWYDPNDMGTMYQDAAGTVPVTAVGQPLGLVLDKSKGLVLGQELVISPDFQSSLGWENISTGTGTMSIASGKLIATGVDGENRGRFNTKINTEIGKTYQFTSSGKFLTGAAGSITYGIATTPSGGGTFRFVSYPESTFIFTATANITYVYFSTNAIGASVEFSKISVKELPGNHAYQTTSAARPVLRDAPRRIDFDAVDDKLITNLPAQLTGCTVIRSVPGVGVQLLTNQTIPATYEDNKDHCGLIVINRALTPSETSAIAAEFNKRAGV